MKTSLYVLVFFTVFIAAGTFLYKSIAPYLPEDTRGRLERDGGVYASFDGGIAWAQEPAFTEADVYDLAYHPGEAGVLYAATSRGLYIRTGDERAAWQEIMGGVPVFSIDIDMQDKQTAFITTENESGQGEIARSRGEIFAFLPVFTTPASGEGIVDVVVDFFDPSVVLALTSRGAFLRSDDGGDSWRIVHRFATQNARFLLMDPNDSRILYAVTSEGLFSSIDKGATWRDRTRAVASFRGGSAINDIAIAQNNSSLLYLATDYGILRSQNGGDTFADVDFLLPPGTQPIHAVALFPQDSRIVWVAVGPQIYHSNDGGKSWQVRTLSTNRALRVLAPHPQKDTTVFAGARI